MLKPAHPDDDTTRRLRVTVVQPSLAAYRQPVYRELAKRPGIDLRVRYGSSPRIPNVEPDGFQAEPAPITRIPVGRRRLMWQPAQLREASLRFSDVVVYSWDAQYLTLPPALLRARKAGVGTVLWGHGYSKASVAWRDALRTRLGRLADCLLFYNQSAAQHHIDLGFPDDRVFVAPNSLDQAPIQAARERWLSDPDRLTAFRREHDLIDRPVILFVSRLDANNGLDLLLSAVDRLRSRHPRLAVVVVGKGESEQSRLTSLADKLGLDETVRFAGAIYEEDQLAPYFLAADVFCYPQNIGLSLLHAFGYGLPVVTSDRMESQNPEIEALEDGVNGRLYRHGDADALAQTLNDLLTDAEQARRVGGAGHDAVDRRYNLKAMVDGMEAAIRRAVLASSSSEQVSSPI